MWLPIAVVLAVYAAGVLTGWLLRGAEHTAARNADLRLAMELAAARGELGFDRDDWFTEETAAVGDRELP